MIGETEQDSIVIVDDSYSLIALNTSTRKQFKKINVGSSVLKCSLVAEACLFLGLTSGMVQMYDAYTLDFIAEVQTMASV